MRKPKIRLGTWVFLLFLLSHCSNKDTLSYSQIKFPISIKLSYDTPKSLNLESGDSQDLNLVSTGTNLVISVSNCASGYTLSSFTITSGIVNLYKGDKNCLVKLKGFTLGSVSYSPTGGTDFTTWLNNDIATFKNIAGSDTIKVFVSSQVTQAGVQTSDTIVYKFTDVASTITSNLGNTTVSTPVPLTINGQAAPNFTLTQARYLSTNATGSANMSFTLECGSTLTGSTLSTYACSSALLNSQLDYIFIHDYYSQGSITVSQANFAFSTVTPTAVGSLIVAPGSSDLNSNTLTKGGFYTSNAFPLVTGTTPVYPSGLNNVFMLRWRDAGGNTLSYLYFYVTINAITTPSTVSGCGTTFAGGSGTVGDPYQINDSTTLSHTASCTSSSNYFVQTQNIDLGGAISPWTPIPLYGNYNGNNYTISNLYINDSTGSLTYLGLFSNINVGASVSNLVISNASISGTKNFMGPLAAVMSGGTVSNVSSSGSISGNLNSANGIHSGGLIGIMYGGTVSNVSSSVGMTLAASSSSVNSETPVGGLVGFVYANQSNIALTNCSATGAATATGSVNNSHIYGGGLIGVLQTAGFSASISRCYATGNQSFSITNIGSTIYGIFIGGLIGLVTGTSGPTISQSLATGNMNISGTSTYAPHVGGFIGRIETGTISDSYSMGSVSVPGTNSGLGGFGGFLGQGFGTTLARSYSAAISVTGTGAANRQDFIGAPGAGPTPVNNYYYKTANVNFGNSVGGVTAYTTQTQMQTQSNFSGFDFSTPIWRMPTANPLSPNGLLSPVLNWQCGSNGITCQ